MGHHDVFHVGIKDVAPGVLRGHQCSGVIIETEGGRHWNLHVGGVRERVTDFARRKYLQLRVKSVGAGLDLDAATEVANCTPLAPGSRLLRVLHEV